MSDARQPLQTMIEGAHRFDERAIDRIRDSALRAMERHAGDPAILARALGLSDATLEDVHARIAARIRQRPLEDYRLDFEDGYGDRSDDEEDTEALRAARALAAALDAGAMPDRFGIRIKPLGGGTERRGLRTLEQFVGALAEAAGALPDGFVVTLPKLTDAEQAAKFAQALAALEAKLRLAERSLRFEFMVELPAIVLGPDGRSPLRAALDASDGRATAAHFGTYDYTAACGIAPSHQSMHHPVCEFAKNMMRVAFAGTGLWLCDGSTNVLPVEPHPDAPATDAARTAANRAAVHAAWRRHYDDVTGSLARGFYQGWDLHPAQLVTRYAALHVFFRAGFDGAAARLRAMLAPHDAAAGPAVMDDPATGQTLLDFVRRTARCGALDGADVARQSGLSVDELNLASYSELRAARSNDRAR